MAKGAVVYKADLQVADMDRGHYADYPLIIACHPSETEERMMIRVLAFALHASEGTTFGRGLSSDDEPDVWVRDLTGAIDTWIDVGLPEDRLVRRACGRAREVVVYAYGGARLNAWWAQSRDMLMRCANLSVYSVSQQDTAALGKLATRSMKLSCTVQDGHVWLGAGGDGVSLEPEALKRA